jgi:toxin ParE1/3/4
VTVVVYADAAERDLLEIASWIAADDPAAARRLVKAIRNKCALLRTLPFMGPARPDIRPDVRTFPSGSYVVYYTFQEDLDRVDILTIRHGRRRPPTAADFE